eukprot:7110647-Pyramimonas_sp.AAC.1
MICATVHWVYNPISHFYVHVHNAYVFVRPRCTQARCELLITSTKLATKSIIRTYTKCTFALIFSRNSAVSCLLSEHVDVVSLFVCYPVGSSVVDRGSATNTLVRTYQWRTTVRLYLDSRTTVV